MSTCISSHGEYDAHETDPDTYVCKWCHEFDETGALAEIARLRRGPVTGMEHAIEKAAEIIGGHVDHYIGIEPDQPLDAARALAEAGLLAPAPLQEEWAAIAVERATTPQQKARAERNLTAALRAKNTGKVTRR